MRAALLACALVLPAGAVGAAAAQDAPAQLRAAQPSAAEVRAFLAGVEAHPSLRAARAALRAAEANLEAALAPVALSGSYGYVSVDAEPFDSDLPDPIDEVLEPLLAVEPTGQQLDLSATFRPFPFGDIGDLVEQRRAEVARSLLALREARAGLEAQALETNGALLLARRAEALAERSARLAADALAATELRAERGGATESEAARARLELARAEQGLASAARQRAATEAALAQLVGDARLRALPELPPEPLPTAGSSPAVARGRLDLRLAEIGLRNAERALLPTAQASYSLPFDAAGGTLTLSLESRTLQPTLGYSYSGGAAAQGGAAGGLGALGPEVNGTFSVGVALELSPESYGRRDAARAQRDAAAAALEAAQQRAALEAEARDDALRGARERLELAGRDLDLAERDVADTRTRLELGLASELELARARLAARRAELDRFDARLGVLRAVLDEYRATATPPSEVLP